MFRDDVFLKTNGDDGGGGDDDDDDDCVPGGASDTSDDVTSEAESQFIVKPSGEVGRPGRGGYNLQKVLHNYGWDEKAFLAKRVSHNSIISCFRLNLFSGICLETYRQVSRPYLVLY